LGLPRVSTLSLWNPQLPHFMSWRRRPIRDMIVFRQSGHLVNCVILTHHTACLAPPDVTILRMHISSESLFPFFPKRLALRMGSSGRNTVWAGTFLGILICIFLYFYISLHLLDHSFAKYYVLSNHNNFGQEGAGQE
jgi:hypothetical protein